MGVGYNTPAHLDLDQCSVDIRSSSIIHYDELGFLANSVFQFGSGYAPTIGRSIASMAYNNLLRHNQQPGCAHNSRHLHRTRTILDQDDDCNLGVVPSLQNLALQLKLVKCGYAFERMGILDAMVPGAKMGSFSWILCLRQRRSLGLVYTITRCLRGS